MTSALVIFLEAAMTIYHKTITMQSIKSEDVEVVTVALNPPVEHPDGCVDSDDSDAPSGARTRWH